MKSLLLLLIFLPCISHSQTMTFEERIELERRIKLYQLDDDSDEPVLSREKYEYNHEIIPKLNLITQNRLIPRLESVAGKCTSGNCLKPFSSYQVLQLPLKNICFPHTSCGYYECMEDKYQCNKEGVDYFSKMAGPACRRFNENTLNRKWFSQTGFNWVYSVMICLQEGLTEECEVQGNCDKKTAKETCNYIKNFNLSFHKQCYLNSGIGVCRLPLRDKINLWKTVKPFIRKGERKQIYEVILSCIRRGL